MIAKRLATINPRLLRRGWLFAWSIRLISVLILTGCAADKDSAPKPETPPADKLTVQLYWMPSAEFMPFYGAQLQGYYQEENLDVTFLTGGYDAEGNYIDVLPLLVSGAVDVGVLGSDQVLEARANGKPVVAITLLQQRFPYGLMSLKTSAIVRPDDLRGKRIMLWSEDRSFDMFLNIVGLSRDDVTVVMGDEVGGYDFARLIDGTVDAMIVSLEEITDFTQMGNQASVIFFDDYGLAMYANTLAVTEQTISERPELIQRFINATLRGFAYGLANPDAIGARLAQLRGTPDNVLGATALVRAVIPLANPPNSRPGMMQLEVWQGTLDLLTQIGVITEPLDVTAAFDTRFVEAYYASAAQ